MIFQLESGGDVDVVTHTASILNQYPDAKIYVGCDSQNKKHSCIYATVIAYRFTYGGGTRRGARYIYKTEWVDRLKDKFSRLEGEIFRSVNLARWLEEQGLKVFKIDLDFNHDQTAGSHNMVAYGTGYCKSFGFNSTCKPHEQVASRAGDHIVKKKTKKNRRHHQKKKRLAA